VLAKTFERDKYKELSIHENKSRSISHQIGITLLQLVDSN